MPAWRGDGRLLAYAASPLAGGSFDVWTIGIDGGTPRLAASGPSEQIAPAFDRAGRVTVRLLEPGDEFPVKTSDSGTQQVGTARAAARSRSALPVPADDGRHEARLRVGDGQRRRGAGLGPRQPPERKRPDAGDAARPNVRPLRPRLCRRRPAALHALAESHALAPARLPALRAADARRRARRARPQERLLPRRPLRAGGTARDRVHGRQLLRQLRSVESGCARRRAGHIDRLHRPLPGPLPRPEPRAPRRPGRRVRARPPREPRPAARGDRLHEQRRLDTREAQLERRHAPRRDAPHVPELGRRRARREPSAAGSANRSGSRSGSSRLRPSRSSRNAFIPSARAPSMSSS